MYHPDNENGSAEITRKINAEYDDIAFSILREKECVDGQSYTQEGNE